MTGDNCEDTTFCGMNGNLCPSCRREAGLREEKGQEPVTFTGDEAIDTALRQVVELLQTKGKEYTAGDADRLKNFREVAEAAGITPEQAWLVFFNKHYKSIQYYVRAGSTLTEPIEGRITDAIAYLLLLYKMASPGEKVQGVVLDQCQDCQFVCPSSMLHDKGDHHGGTKHVCVDRAACHKRRP